LAKGLSGKSMMLDLIPKDKEVKRDAIITTNSLGGIFPKGLLVGTVDEVDKNDVESFQTAKITPAFEMDKIEEVFVIIGYKFQEGISAEKTVN
jgi:rod shape-determining protein MreC